MNLKHSAVATGVWAGVIGGIWAYSLSAHFLALLDRSWPGRVFVLLLVTFAASFHAFKLTRNLAPRWQILSGPDRIKITLAALILAGVIYSALANPFPHFAATRKLEISTTGQKNPQSSAYEIELVSIANGNDPIIDLVKDGVWQQTEWALFTSGTQPASLGHEKVYTGPVDLALIFRAGPRAGIARIRMDGIEQEVDLYKPEDKNKEIHLRGALPWQRMSSTYKLLWVATIISDLLSLASLVFAIGVYLLAGNQNPQPAFLRLRRLVIWLFPILLLLNLLWNLVTAPAVLPALWSIGARPSPEALARSCTPQGKL